MAHQVSLVLEFNVREKGHADSGGAASLWFVPQSLAGDSHDLDHYKPQSVLLVGPIAWQLADQMRRSLTDALAGIGVMAEHETTADD